MTLCGMGQGGRQQYKTGIDELCASSHTWVVGWTDGEIILTKKMTKAERKAATRELAISTARKCWADPGTYETQGMREIAAAMGMSTGAIFANFASKADLWRAAMGYEPPVDCVETREVLRPLGVREIEDAPSAPAADPTSGERAAGGSTLPGAARQGDAA